MGAITCLRQGRDPAIGAIIITGGKDGTCRVWTETAIRKAAGGSQIDDDDDLAYITSLSEMGVRIKFLMKCAAYVPCGVTHLLCHVNTRLIWI